MFSGMDREQWHVGSFRRSFLLAIDSYVVIDNFNIGANALGMVATIGTEFAAPTLLPPWLL
jgi:hypothetical protein